jgi:hypothetical protein
VSVFQTSFRQLNLLCAFWTPDDVRGEHNILYWFGQNISISSHRRLTLSTSLMIKTRRREGGEASKSLIRGEGGYKVES